MKTASIFALVFLISLATVNCSNLQTDSQTLCPVGLLQKMNNPPRVSGINDFIDLVDTIQAANDALAVVHQIASFNQAHMETFFFLAQAIYQTEKDYEALDQETKDLCDTPVSEDFCMSTCFDPFSFAQVAAPKPAFYNCSADEDPLCELGPTLDPARKCKKSLRSYVMRYKYQSFPAIAAAELFRAFAGSGLCVDDNFANAFVPRSCEQQFMKNYRGKTLLALPMLAPDSSIKDNLRGENLMTQLQSVYLLTREKFDHQIAEISMRCKVYINTDPVSDEEIDAVPTDP